MNISNYEVQNLKQEQEENMDIENKAQKLKQPLFFLQNNKWVRGGIYGKGSKTVTLYDKDENGIFIEIGAGIF